MATQTYQRYEHHVPEDSVVELGQICDNCSRFIERSSLIQNLFHGNAIKLGASEMIEFCCAEQLKAGYFEGCHFCALVWVRGNGCLFDPANPTIVKDSLSLYVSARDPDKEYEMQMQEPENGFIQQWLRWWFPEYIGERGHIEVCIPEILDTRDRPSLYIHRFSDKRLNKATVEIASETISTRHDSKLSKVKSWFQTCSENHTKCREFAHLVAPKMERPSRLLDLKDDTIKLECAVQDIENLEYTTLSHMWGPNPSACLTLKQGNLEEFKVGIPLAELPEKYTDAIRITIALGFRYLWIDSLCIIQDSADDWKREALKMAAVYGGTACNISHTQPPIDDGSRIHLRDPRVYFPCRIQPSTPPATSWLDFGWLNPYRKPSSSQSLVFQHLPGFISGFWSPSLYQEKWPLISRAWVFQERLLCPRNLYYGHDRLIWECCTTTSDEFYGKLQNTPRSKERWHSVFSGVSRSQERLHEMFSDPAVQRFDVDCTLQEQWDLLVQEYRAKKLTYESDRVIAFAGIVKAVKNKTNLTYLAGIWKEFAEVHLLWSVNAPPSKSNDLCQKKRMELPDVPSWSWFSVPILEILPGQDMLDFRIPRIVSTNWLYALYKAKVLSYHHEKLESDPDSLLYEFSGLGITLRTHRVEAKLGWEGDTVQLETLKEYEREDADCWINYIHDDINVAPGSDLPDNVCMILTVFEAWETHVGGGQRRIGMHRSKQREGGPPIYRTNWLYAGLVVVPATTERNGERCFWRRIGVFLVSLSIVSETHFKTPFRIDETEEDIELV